MILDELIKTNNRWADIAQPQLMEATIATLGNSSTTYTVEFKNGSRVPNISGPSDLRVGNAVAVAAYPGRAKKYVILQKTAGGSSQNVTVVMV